MYFLACFYIFGSFAWVVSGCIVHFQDDETANDPPELVGSGVRGRRQHPAARGGADSAGGAGEEPLMLQFEKPKSRCPSKWEWVFYINVFLACSSFR